MIFAIIFAVAFCIASIQCVDDCANRECPPVPKHYDELGCREIRDNGDCCATRFECPNFTNYDSAKCHFKGKLYNAGDTIDDNEVPSSLTNCTCQGRPAALTCAQRECPDGITGGRCLSTYSDLRRCREKQICDESEIAKLAECHVEGNIYHSGQRFIPESQPCYECLCTDDYDNTTAVAENVKCEKLDCSIELLHLNDIRRGCVPIYIGADDCCPQRYQCPTDDNQLQESDVDDNSVGPTCTFGKLTLRIGQQLHIDDDECTKCKCTIPPTITCTMGSVFCRIFRAPSRFGHASNQRPECATDSECASDLACIDGHCKYSCQRSPCGPNAICSPKNGIPTCECEPEHIGDPYARCMPFAIERKRECTTDSECASNLVCFDGHCKDPCHSSPCGPNAICRKQNGISTCECASQFIGDPHEGCRPRCIENSECPANRACIQNKCQDPCHGVCDQDFVCQVKDHVPVCSYTRGFIYPEAEKKINPCHPSPCGPNAICSPRNDIPICKCEPKHYGNPYMICNPFAIERESGCIENSECPANRACIQNECQDLVTKPVAEMLCVE